MSFLIWFLVLSHLEVNMSYFGQDRPWQVTVARLAHMLAYLFMHPDIRGGEKTIIQLDRRPGADVWRLQVKNLENQAFMLLSDKSLVQGLEILFNDLDGMHAGNMLEMIVLQAAASLTAVHPFTVGELQSKHEDRRLVSFSITIRAIDINIQATHGPRDGD